MTGVYFDLYGEINNGAHRKAADLIGAPSFVWHQALWNPPQSESFTDKDARGNLVLTYVKRLHQHLYALDNNVVPRLGQVRIQHDDRVRVITFEFVWRGVRAKIRVENHTEYVSLTSILDASVRLSEPAGSASLRNKIETFLGNFRIGTWRPLAAAWPKFDDIEDTYSFIYRDIWEKHFFPEILNVDGMLAKNATPPEAGSLGARFADFRGFVSCEPYPDNVDDCTKESKEDPDLAKLGLEYQRVQEPFYKIDEDQRGRWQRTGRPSENWARRRLDNAWPFLKLATDDGASPLPGRTEYTASRVMEGRALYVSALAPQPELGVPGAPERPLYFYVHSVTQCERQIGRLIDRLCQLGTLRLAAIIALPEFKTIGQTLADVSKEIDAARNELHSLVQNARVKGFNRDKAEQEILGKLDSIQNKMSSLSRGRPGSQNKGLGEASLEYRLLRSRYYRQGFESLIDSMRIERIEGYQPYDEFIARRLGSAFNFIEGLGARVEEVRGEWRALDQLYLTTMVTILTHRIQDQQTQNGELIKRIERTQEELSTIEFWGEVFLLVVLIPLSLTEMILFVLPACETSPWCATSLWSPGYSYQRAIALAVWGAFAFIVSVRLIWKYGKRLLRFIRKRLARWSKKDLKR